MADVPPLPQAKPTPENMPAGCYLIRCDLAQEKSYEGTLRVENTPEGSLISGDLYFVGNNQNSFVLPTPDEHIRHFPVENYCYYMRCINITQNGQSFELRFKLYQYQRKLAARGQKPYWESINGVITTLTITITTAQLVALQHKTVLELAVDNPLLGFGSVKLVWLSEKLRRAELTLCAFTGISLPLINQPESVTLPLWEKVKQQLNWDFQILTPDSPLQTLLDTYKGPWLESRLHEILTTIANPHPNVQKFISKHSGSWEEADLKKLSDIVQENALNITYSDWRYYALFIDKMPHTNQGEIYGLMFDCNNTDANADAFPRQGMAVASKSKLDNAINLGFAKGLELSTYTQAYLHTVLHELGHSMNLEHPKVAHTNSIMTSLVKVSEFIPEDNFLPLRKPPEVALTPEQTSKVSKKDLRSLSIETQQAIKTSLPANAYESIFNYQSQIFPYNINWAYAPEDCKKLSHYPDILIRPGGLNFLGSDSHDEASLISVEDTPDVRVPLGAPVQLKIKLKCQDAPVKVPKDLSFKNNNIRGSVKQVANDTIRTYGPIIRYLHVEEQELVELAQDETIEVDLVLLRGKEGALFPEVGQYEITTRLSWEVENEVKEFSYKTIVEVTDIPQQDRIVAQALLDEPTTLLAFVIGNNTYTQKGVEVINRGFENDSLKKYYAPIKSWLELQKAYSTPSTQIDPQRKKDILNQVTDIVKNNNQMTLSDVRRFTKSISLASQVDPVIYQDLVEELSKKVDTQLQDAENNTTFLRCKKELNQLKEQLG